MPEKTAQTIAQRIAKKAAEKVFTLSAARL
jgi:hypothetical protein